MLQCTISLRPSNGRYPAQEGCQRIITKEQKWFKMMIRQQSHYKSFHKNLSSQSHQSRKNRLWFKPQKPRNPINRVWKRMGKSLKPSFSTSLNYRRKTKITGLREHAVWKGESQKDWFPLSPKAYKLVTVQMLPTAIRHKAPFHSEGSSWVVSTLAIVQKRKQWICLTLWWFF